jgi:hypothetical protein
MWASDFREAGSGNDGVAGFCNLPEFAFYLGYAGARALCAGDPGGNRFT